MLCTLSGLSANIIGDKAPLKTGVRGYVIGGEGGWGVVVPEGGRPAPRHQCGGKRRVYAIPTNTGNNQVTRLWPIRALAVYYVVLEPNNNVQVYECGIPIAWEILHAH